MKNIHICNYIQKTSVLNEVKQKCEDKLLVKQSFMRSDVGWIWSQIMAVDILTKIQWNHNKNHRRTIVDHTSTWEQVIEFHISPFAVDYVSTSNVLSHIFIVGETFISVATVVVSTGKRLQKTNLYQRKTLTAPLKEQKSMFTRPFK